MAQYAGENLIVASQVRHPRTKVLLTNVDGIAVTIDIKDIDGVTLLVDGASMIYDSSFTDAEFATSGAWVYVWASEPTAGAYQTKIHAVGGDLDNWEFKTIRVRADKS